MDLIGCISPQSVSEEYTKPWSYWVCGYTAVSNPSSGEAEAGELMTVKFQLS